ncbi:uncharacterized protein ZBAI_06708 [Zygosaccharomyces bailii ISA1307]|nr:uncharacterized protein ZBAI_06708 [Zygosaccharomyces bailii ISA1307]
MISGIRALRYVLCVALGMWPAYLRQDLKQDNCAVLFPYAANEGHRIVLFMLQSCAVARGELEIWTAIAVWKPPQQRVRQSNLRWGGREPRTSITRWKYSTPSMNLNTPPSLAKYWVHVVNCD